MQNLDILNDKYAIAGSLKFELGKGGLVKAVLSHRSSAQLEIYLYGAHITSWSSQKFTEVFFLSSKADFLEGKAIRGGIPLVFPQFGKGQLPSHGFVRTALWEVSEARSNTDETVLVLELKDNDKTRALWPHKFKLQFEVCLTEKLTTRLRVINTDTSDFLFQNALHSYFAVSDIADVSLVDLAALNYLDNLKDRIAVKQEQSELTFAGEVDRIYQSSPETLVITDRQRQIQIHKINFADSVVWNPAESGSKAIADLQPDDYKNFICVESANTFPQIRLAAGATYESSQVLEIS